MRLFSIAALGALAITSGAAELINGAPQTEVAQAAYYSVTSENSSLIMPSDYSQYLDLNAPTACSIASGYIAVADGKQIYVYNKMSGEYGMYTHEYNTDDALNSVAQVDFCGDGNLYFTDASTYLYRLSLSDLTVARTGITCSTFVCSGTTIYFATVVNGRVTVASVSANNADMSNVEAISTLNTYSSPSMCCDDNGNLYYTDGVYLYDKTANNITNLPLNGSVTACRYADGNFYFCDSTGRLSRYNYASGAAEEYFDGAYCNIDYYDGKLYAINASAVEEYDCAEKKFTDYRICSSSSAVGRLNGACDAALVGDSLIIAESGNARVTIYDESDGVSVFYPDFTPTNIAADSSTIIVSGASSCAIYNYTGDSLYTYSDLSRGEEIRGAASVYGTYYLVTSGNTFIKISEENGAYTASKVSKQLTGVSDGLSSDVYGNLLVKTTDGSVYSFSEEAFMSQTEAGAFKYAFPSAVTGFFSDYRGDAFGISGSSIISDCGITASVSSEGCVFMADETPVAVAACHERGCAYIVYENYVVYTEAINIPTLNDIPTENSAAAVFADGSAETETVTIKKNAVAIFFDFSKYENAAYFPYSSHERISADTNAVVMAETSSYYVVGLVSEKTNKYKTGIVLKSSCSALDVTALKYTPEGFSTYGYTTNDIPLYKHACFSSKTASLEKGAAVVVEYAINLGSGYDFCKVSYSYNGKSYEGYVPINYLIPTDETAEKTSTISYAYIDVEDEYYTLLADDGSTLKVSTDEKFTVTGDPYTEDEVKLSYTSEGKTYYTIINSSLLKTTNTVRIRIFAVALICVIIVLIVVNYTIFCKRHPEKKEIEY